MATLTEIRDLYSDDSFRNKVTIAVTIAAYNLIKTGTSPTAADMAFAVSAMNSPDSVGSNVTKMVLAANSAAPAVQIQDASDADIQAAVDVIVPTLVAAGI